MSKEIKPGDWRRRLHAGDERRRLHAGDEVTWNDPNEGRCTRSGTICEIRYIGDDAAAITFTDGWQAEVFLSELS